MSGAPAILTGAPRLRLGRLRQGAVRTVGSFTDGVPTESADASKDVKEEGLMAHRTAPHSHKFSIADDDAVQVLLDKPGAPNGSREVDEEKLHKALASASRRYAESGEEASRAFFHGLLTGYAVGLKHR